MDSLHTATLKLAKIGLQAARYRVVCHSTCFNALDAARHADFSAVVLDLLMPHMDGFESLDHFRRIDKCRHTPVIVWTGKDTTAAEMERLRDSAQTIAMKDCDGIDAVLRKLKRHVGADESNAPVRRYMSDE